MRRLLLLATTLLLAACASTPAPDATPAGSAPMAGSAPPPPQPPPPDAGIETKGGPAIPADQNYARMRVFYATDRKPANDFATADQSDKYTGDRGPMAYGQAFVSIPRGHVAGELEAPSIFRLEFREDPDKHVVLLQTIPQPKETFLQAMRARVNASKGKNAFIFVHGYNVAFADAARRTAQLSYDLSFDGAPIFFSWPSQAALQGYTIDEANIEWATSHIKQFIIDAAKSPAPTISIWSATAWATAA
jgi:esterase/lipase superfamily enzyme